VGKLFRATVRTTSDPRGLVDADKAALVTFVKSYESNLTIDGQQVHPSCARKTRRINNARLEASTRSTVPTMTAAVRMAKRKTTTTHIELLRDIYCNIKKVKTKKKASKPDKNPMEIYHAAQRYAMLSCTQKKDARKKKGNKPLS